MLEHKVVNAFRLCYSLQSMLFHVSMLGFCCAVVFLCAFFFSLIFRLVFVVVVDLIQKYAMHTKERTVQKTLSENNFEIETKTNAKAKRINRVWVTYAQLESSAGHICHTLQLSIHYSKELLRMHHIFNTNTKFPFFCFCFFFFNSFHFLLFSSIRIYMHNTKLHCTNEFCTRKIVDLREKP